MTFDNWTITDADTVWDFRILVTADTDTGRPDKEADVYDPECMERDGDAHAAEWARQALKAWNDDLWHWAVLTVTPVLKDTGVVFEQDDDSMGGVEYGWLPGGEDGNGINTANRDYLRKSHLNDMIHSVREKANEQFDKIKEG